MQPDAKPDGEDMTKNRFNNNNLSGKIWTLQFFKVFLIATMVSMVTQLQATTFPLYVQSLGGNLVIAGLMTSVYMGTSALCKPFVGKILNNNPRKKLFIIFGIIFAIILSSFGFMNVVVMIMIVRAINAPCYSIFSTSATTMATDFIPDDRLIEGIGQYNFSATISSAFGASLALFIINRFGYKYLFFTCSVFVVIGLIIGSTLKYDDPILRKREYLKDHPEGLDEETPKKYTFSQKVKTLFTTPMLFPCIMMFFIHIGAGGTVTYLPTWAKTVGIEGIGIFFTVQAITLAISRLTVGKITKKLGSRWTLMIGIFCVEICMFGIRFCTSIPPIICLGLLLGFGNGLISPTMHAIVVMLVPAEEKGMANSVFAMSTEAGSCVCSLTLGIIAQKLGILNVFSYGAIFPLISLLVYFTKVRGQIKDLGI